MLALDRFSGKASATLHSALAFDAVLTALNLLAKSSSRRSALLYESGEDLFRYGMTGVLKGSSTASSGGEHSSAEVGDFVRLMLTPNQAEHSSHQQSNENGDLNGGAAGDGGSNSEKEVDGRSGNGSDSASEFRLRIDVLQSSPWLIDGVVRVSASGSPPMTPADDAAKSLSHSVEWEKVPGVGHGHLLTRSNFEDIKRDKSEW